MENTHLYIYVITMLPLALYLTFQSETKYKFVTFVIVYWLLAGPTLNTELFIVNIESWYFDIQPARFIFIVFTVYLIALWGTHRRKRIRENGRDNEEIPNAVGNPAFEKFLYIFLALYLLVNIIHTRDVLTMREIAASYTNLLVFPVIYLVLKKTADSGMIKTVFRALLIVCILSGIVGIYQFLVDPYFLRIGAEFLAFGTSLRANGIYRAEYLQGSFLLLGIIVALITIHSKIGKVFLIPLFLIAIVLTFHRATWIITLLVFTLYLIKVKKMKVWQLTIIGVFMIIFVYIVLDINPSILARFADNPIVIDRLTSDTMKDRMALYNMVFHHIPQYFLFGVGSTESDIYFHGVLQAGGSLEVALGERGGIHNLYFLMAFFHGTPTALIFTIFLISSFIYFWQKMSHEGKYYFIVTTILLIYIMQNLVNMFYLYHDFGLLLAIFLGVSIAVHQRKINLDRVIQNEKTNR